MKAYKLTTQDFKTRVDKDNETTWGENVTNTVKVWTEKLCSDGVIHAYEHPLVAVFMNPTHANIESPVLWECRTGRKIVKEGQLKLGTNSLTTVRRIPLPVITTEQRTEIAIRIVKLVYTEESWNQWADGWLSGKDRSESSAYAAYAAAHAAYAAVHAAYAAYATAAEAAAHAVEAANMNDGKDIDIISIIEEVVNRK